MSIHAGELIKVGNDNWKEELKKIDNESLSAFLDFYSDRATAHASFLVACAFGLFTVLSFIEGKRLIEVGILSFVYWILWFGGFFSLFNFNFYAMKAHDIKWMISLKKPLLEQVEKQVAEHLKQVRKEKGTNRIYSFVREQFLAVKNSDYKLPILILLYSGIGLLPWLYTTGILSWLFDGIFSINSIQNTALTTSQNLVILGLIFEFLSVLLTVRKLFWGYYKRLEKRTLKQQERKDKIEGSLVLLFLIIGMTFQGIAVLYG